MEVSYTTDTTQDGSLAEHSVIARAATPTPLMETSESTAALSTAGSNSGVLPQSLISHEQLEPGAGLPQLAAGSSRNNSSSQEAHMKYTAPTVPSSPCHIGVPDAVEKRALYRMTLRPDKSKYVTLNFRVMRRDAEMHVGQIVNMCHLKRTDLYTPSVLDRWTQTLSIKIRSTIQVSLVFRSICARLGLQSTIGIKYCLDGFYGIEAFGDAFGNYGQGICPWMEVTGDGTPISLNLEDNDNIYVSIANEKMLELARRRNQQVAEQKAHASLRRSQRQSKVSFASIRSNEKEAFTLEVEN